MQQMKSLTDEISVNNMFFSILSKMQKEPIIMERKENSSKKCLPLSATCKAMPGRSQECKAIPGLNQIFCKVFLGRDP